MERLAILYGGRSAEHEISIITALQAMQALDPTQYEMFPIYLALDGKWYTGELLRDRGFYKKLPHRSGDLEEVTLLPDPSVGGFIRRRDHKTIPIDLCLLSFHGQYGEDGCIQGLLELADLPYTGSGVLSSSLSMSKAHAKAVLRAYGMSVLPWTTVHKRDAIRSLATARKTILQTLDFPLFVKPNHLGSSIGISKAVDAPSLDAALAKVFQYDEIALIEPLMRHFIELNVAILDDDPPIASAVEMPIASQEALSYEDKYLRQGKKTSSTRSRGMADLSRVIDPPDLDPNLKQQIVDEGVRAFRLLHCSGVCRFDFMMDLQTKTLFFNEVNPIPGSFSFYLWDKKDPPFLYTELLNHLLKRAKTVKAMQHSLKKEFGFHAL